jgi:hypothetical protein
MALSPLTVTQSNHWRSALNFSALIIMIHPMPATRIYHLRAPKVCQPIRANGASSLIRSKSELFQKKLFTFPSRDVCQGKGEERKKEVSTTQDEMLEKVCAHEITAHKVEQDD